jgi:hypothetical protein
MKELAQYNPTIVTAPVNFGLPGMERFSFIFGKIFLRHMAIIDRTGTIKTPVRSRSIYPIPQFRAMGRSYEEMCNERAIELLQRADRLNTDLYVSWSGGIDSTTVLVSLLKNATAAQKQKIVVLLSEESITEYPLFYHEHIRGKLRREPSAIFPRVLGSSALYVNGELNDQLFGAQATGDLINLHGDDMVHRPYERSVLFGMFNKTVADAAVTNFYLDLFERVVQTAPIPVKSYADYFWWLNFNLKWQTVALRVLGFTAQRNAANVTPEYVRDRFAPFYGTDDFQLWSMNNLDKRIKDTWSTYKWPCKEIIFEYTKDAEYRDNKLKRGSLYSILIQQRAYNFIDTSMHLSREMDPKEYYDPKNDFV